MKWLTRQDRLPVGRNEKELVTIALARLARSDVSVADSSAPRMGQVHGQVQSPGARSTRAAALNLDSRANDWYHEAGHIRMTEYNAGWKGGGAAPAQDRLEVGHRVHRRDAADPARRHLLGLWKARGLAATGRKDQPRPPTPASPTA